MSKCAIAYAFNSVIAIKVFLEENTFEEDNMFLAEIKMRKNKKGVMAYPYIGAKVALCIIKADKDLSGSVRLATHTLSIATMKEGMTNFYATKRVSGADLGEWLKDLDNKAQFPDLPEYKRPLTQAEVAQRAYAGAGKATQAMVDKLEKMLEEKDAIIEEYEKGNYRELWEELIDENEILEEKLKEKDEEIAKHKDHIENLQAFPEPEVEQELKDLMQKNEDLMQKNEDLEELVAKQKRAIKAQTELNDEIDIDEYVMYKAFFEKFKNATKAKAWIAEYQH